jgi:3-demethylubiquinone-9 3-methyltransferase
MKIHKSPPSDRDSSTSRTRGGLSDASHRQQRPWEIHLADSLSLPCFRALDLRIETKFWDALTDGGEEGPCGWLKDRYRVSWQIVPKVLYELIGDPGREKSQRVMAAMLKMKKIEIAELERAAATA